VGSTIRILHCLRVPFGGLFRHVHDLAKGQAELGLEVGVVCDAGRAGEDARRAISRLADACSLGVTRIPMRRGLGLPDWRAYRRLTGIASELSVDVLHGHGAKGGAFARLAGRALKRKSARVITFYTPHGGSLHYSPSTFMGRLYVEAERRLMFRRCGFPVAPLRGLLWCINAFAAFMQTLECRGAIRGDGGSLDGCAARLVCG
jgi:hypothetical protein